MIKYEIKNRFTGNVQFVAEIDCDKNASESVKKGLAVIWAIKNDVALKGSDIEGANLTMANLIGADLTGEDLTMVNLTMVNLTRANLTDADLTMANLTGADLTGADLTGADLTGADLTGANIDFSCLPLWCGSLKVNMDDKQIIQLLYHTLSIVKNSTNVSDKMKKDLLTKKLLKIANKFHREECDRL